MLHFTRPQTEEGAVEMTRLGEVAAWEAVSAVRARERRLRGDVVHPLNKRAPELGGRPHAVIN
tara:strand:+ start:136 stop:324 length:189 start_codon:yes stop_codon:yes gene_type:complete